MGFDLVTVEKVSKKDHHLFQHIRSDQGYFRHGGGIVSVVSHLGVDMKKTVADRQVGKNHDLYMYKSFPLGQAMRSNDGFQITAAECLRFAEVLTADKIEEALAATEDESPFAIPNNPGAIQFFLDFAEFCEAASEYGGYYNY